MFFNIGGSEILVIAIVALIAVGPEQLPGVLRKVGRTVSQVRSMTSSLRDEFMSGLEEVTDLADPDEWMGTGGADDPVVPRGYADRKSGDGGGGADGSATDGEAAAVADERPTPSIGGRSTTEPRSSLPVTGDTAPPPDDDPDDGPPETDTMASQVDDDRPEGEASAAPARPTSDVATSDVATSDVATSDAAASNAVASDGPTSEGPMSEASSDAGAGASDDGDLDGQDGATVDDGVPGREAGGPHSNGDRGADARAAGRDLP